MYTVDNDSSTEEDTMTFGTYDPTKAETTRSVAQAAMDRVFALLPGTAQELAQRAGLSRYDVGTQLIGLIGAKRAVKHDTTYYAN